MGNEGFNNPTIASKGDAYNIGLKEMEAMTPKIKEMQDIATTGVEELRAVSNPPITNQVDLDKVASKSSEILDKYRNIARQAGDNDKGAKDFPSGSAAPTEKYDLNVDADEEKRIKDNLRDESKIERPFEFDKLKSFSKLHANLTMKLKKVKALLKATKDRNIRNRLNYFQARIVNDMVTVVAGMESGQWNNPDSKTEKDPDKDFEKFMKPENTGEIKNTINEELKKANFQTWSKRVPKELSKKAEEDLSKAQTQNIEQAVKELKSNDEDYKQNIEKLEAQIGKKANKEKTAMEDEPQEDKGEEKEDDKKEEDNGDEKKEDKKDDKKKDKKDDGKDKDKDEDSKDSKGKGKDDIKEKMRKMREKRKVKKEGPSTDGEGDEGMDKPAGPPKPTDGPPMGGAPEELAPAKPPIMGGVKDDLTAEFTREQSKNASYWEVTDGEKKPILRFTGANAFGKTSLKIGNFSLIKNMVVKYCQGLGWMA